MTHCKCIQLVAADEALEGLAWNKTDQVATEVVVVVAAAAAAAAAVVVVTKVKIKPLHVAISIIF